MERSLRRELKSVFGPENYWFNTSKYKNAVEIKIKTNNENITFLFPNDEFNVFFVFCNLA